MNESERGQSETVEIKRDQLIEWQNELQTAVAWSGRSKGANAADNVRKEIIEEIKDE